MPILREIIRLILRTIMKKTALILLFLSFLMITVSSCSSSKTSSKNKGKKEKKEKKKKNKKSTVKPYVEKPNVKDAKESSPVIEKYAKMLGVKPESLKNEKLYQLIDEWWGTPYKFGGKTKNGIDCSAFSSVLYQQCYQKTIVPPAYSIFDQCQVVEKSKLKEGDLVFFKTDKNRISHVGVYLHNNKFVHASTSKGVRIDDLNDPYYIKVFFNGGKLK